MTRLLSALLLLGCLAVAGCAQDNNRPENDRFGGFYSGVVGGAVRP